MCFLHHCSLSLVLGIHEPCDSLRSQGRNRESERISPFFCHHLQYAEPIHCTMTCQKSRVLCTLIGFHSLGFLLQHQSQKAVIILCLGLFVTLFMWGSINLLCCVCQSKLLSVYPRFIILFFAFVAQRCSSTRTNFLVLSLLNVFLFLWPSWSRLQNSGRTLWPPKPHEFSCFFYFSVEQTSFHSILIVL